MAIEKMSMLNLVGSIKDVDNVARKIILSGNLDVVSALNEIKQSRFNLDVTERNVDSLAGMASVHPLELSESYRESLEKMKIIENAYNHKFKIKKEYLKQDIKLEKMEESINALYKEFSPIVKKQNQLQEEIYEAEKSIERFKLIENIDINIEDLDNMEKFNYYFGSLTKENRIKVKRNYENIPAIVIHEGTVNRDEVYLVIYPVDLGIETERILRSLNFKKLEIKKGFKGKPIDIIKKLEEDKKERHKELQKIKNELDKLKADNKERIEKCYTIFKIQERVNELKKLMVATRHLFYLSAWIPTNCINEFEDKIKDIKDLTIHYENQEDLTTVLNPPTKLKNNWLLSPFEYLIEMYATPSYNEIDPTSLLAITYMLFFGAMFGDVGQGLVIFLGGMFLARKNGSKFAKLISRVGISSMIFGVLYGSVFGFEEILPAILISPFENIQTILISSVLAGIILTYISFTFNIINGIKLREYKDALFGKNGIVGALFYALILYLIAQNIIKLPAIPLFLGMLILLLFIAIMIVREPLTNLIFSKRPLYSEDVSSYYIESTFEIIETLLSMISSTLSFIRIGAFALTHVGLFMAFQVISELIDNVFFSIVVLTVGNIVIIALEGLIVGIQALRLEYYELFSKFYRGEGRIYRPFKIEKENQ
ncbi:V-type ATP synthase subunit I [Senegalia sp. (in: firmicutes)]|uniref:V-type ATP synthase subunit I n=1 Tax=Senegalia sp. (in: firmicutes) TaxID=1924098 RepID=UPI003F98E820